MNKTTAQQPNGERICARCGGDFTCGTAAGQEHCWCFELPHVIPIENINNEGCLCPACLRERIQSIQAHRKTSAG